MNREDSFQTYQSARRGRRLNLWSIDCIFYLNPRLSWISASLVVKVETYDM